MPSRKNRHRNSDFVHLTILRLKAKKNAPGLKTQFRKPIMPLESNSSDKKLESAVALGEWCAEFARSRLTIYVLRFTSKETSRAFVLPNRHPYI